MAVFSIADMSAAMSTVYRRKISQTQRKTPTLRILAALGSFQQGNTGINITFTPKFSGQAAGNPNLDGGAFLTAASDAPSAVSLGYGTYEAPAKITDDMLWRAGVQAGIIPDYNTFDNVFNEARVDALQASLKLANQQIFSGTGLTNQMTGLSTAVASSGAYGGLTHGEWISTVTINGGVLRSLTMSLIKTHVRTIAVTAKAGRPNLGICPPAIFDALEALFDAYLQIPQPMQALPGPGRERVSMNPGAITTAGGRINMDGFRHMYWASQNLYFVEDPDCTNTALANPNNCIYFLNTDELALNYLSPPGPRMAAQDAQAVQAVEQDMGPLAGWQFESISRGRIDHAMQWDLTGKLGMKLWSRNAHGWLGDIQ